MRKIEEIKADIDKTQGCMFNRHDCDNQCEKCDYLNYDKNYFKLREENYQWYQDQNRRATAIVGIETDRLSKMCAAERDGRCVVLPCKVGDQVFEIAFDTSNCPTCLGLGGACYGCDAAIASKIVEGKFDLYMLKMWGKVYHKTREAAEAAREAKEKGPCEHCPTSTYASCDGCGYNPAEAAATQAGEGGQNGL